MKPGIEYVADAASDTSVTTTGGDQEGVVRHPAPELKKIVALGSKAIPLLIAHLDDARASRNAFSKTAGASTFKAVPVGFVCLDILTAVTDGPMFVHACADDGFGACIKDGYFFRPDATPAAIRRVKSNWERAFQSGSVTFVYPSWWSAAPN